MNCQDFRSIGRDLLAAAWLNQSDREAAAGHAARCESCRQWLDGQRALNRGFEAWAAAPNPDPAPDLETNIMEAFRARIAERRRRKWMWTAAAAAAVLVMLSLWPRHEPPRSAASETPAAGFIPVRYGAPVRPYETLQVLRMDLPAAELLRMGLRVVPDPVAGTVKTDVLVGEDGLVKGIRFVTFEMNSKGVTQ